MSAVQAESSVKKAMSKTTRRSLICAAAVSEDVDFAAGLRPQEVRHVAGVADGVPAMLLHGVLTPEECAELVEGIPEDGVGCMDGEQVAQRFAKTDNEVSNNADLNLRKTWEGERARVVKSRVEAFDETLAQVLSERLAEHIPQELDGGRFYRVNPIFRFVHQQEGSFQDYHIDGRIPAQPEEKKQLGGWSQSRLTVQVYLGTQDVDFTGGEVTFLTDPDRQAKDVVSFSAGDVLLFYQERLLPAADSPYELLHEANLVTSGNKFACRTQVDYLFEDFEQAVMSNLPDNLVQAAVVRQRSCSTSRSFPRSPGSSSAKSGTESLESTALLSASSNPSESTSSPSDQ